MNIVTLLQKNHGIIIKVNSQNGTPIVKEGDVVNKNSILIGGWIEGNYTGTRYVHANGEVTAKVWYSEKEKISLNQTKKIQTGKAESKYCVIINNFCINFYKTLSKFEKYDTIEETKKIKIFSNFYIPIEVRKKANFEYIEEDIHYSKEEAKNMATDIAKNKLEEQIENKENIIKTYINYNETDEFVEVEVIYEVLEEIGTKEKIVF